MIDQADPATMQPVPAEEAFQPPATVLAQGLPAHATRQLSTDDWSTIKELSHTLEEAGKGTGILPKGITNRAQIAAILLKGQELGLSPMYSLEQISLVGGKPVVQSQALTAIIIQAHGPSAISVVESTDEHSVVEFRRRGASPWRIEWTVDMADKAQLTKKDGPWKQYTRTMLRWRAIAEGARIYFADTIAGLYMPDEMGVPVQVTAQGDMVIDQDAWSAEQPRRAIAAGPAPAAPAQAASTPQSAEADDRPLRDQVIAKLVRMSNGGDEDRLVAGRAQKWLKREFGTVSLKDLSNEQILRLNTEFNFVPVPVAATDDDDEEPIDLSLFGDPETL